MSIAILKSFIENRFEECYIDLVVVFMNIYVSRACCSSVALTSSVCRSSPSYVVTVLPMTNLLWSEILKPYILYI